MSRLDWPGGLSLKRVFREHQRPWKCGRLRSGQEGFRVLVASQWQSTANLISFKLYTAKLLKHETDPIKGINRKTAKDIPISEQFQSTKNLKSKILETWRKTIWLSSVILLQQHVGKLHYNEYVWSWTTHNLKIMAICVYAPRRQSCLLHQPHLQQYWMLKPGFQTHVHKCISEDQEILYFARPKEAPSQLSNSWGRKLYIMRKITKIDFDWISFYFLAMTVEGKEV